MSLGGLTIRLIEVSKFSTHYKGWKRTSKASRRTLSNPRGHPGDVDAAVVDASGGQRGGAAAGVRPPAHPRRALLAVRDGGGAALASAAAHVGDLRQAVHGYENSCGRRKA